MIRKYSTPALTATLLGTLAPMLLTNIAQAKEWGISIIPASLNEDRTIRFLSDNVQLFNFALQADEEVTQRAKQHTIVAEFDFPEGVEVVHQQGYYKLTETGKQAGNGRTIYRYQLETDNASILGKPGARVATEWRLQSVFVKTPAKVTPGQDYVRVRLTDGDYSKEFKWPLQLEKLAPPTRRPKRTSIGLWDYNYRAATNETSSAGIAKFLKDSGITFVQAAGDETYRKAIQKEGITTGGNTHHAFFYGKGYADVDATGKAHPSDFSDPQAILSLPADAEIPGVKQLIEHARQGDGIATYDYEPRGTIGFSDAAIKAFKEKYKVSDADFQTFRAYVAEHGLQTHTSTDPLIAKTWRQWTEFRSDQTSNYVRRIYEAVKAKAPEVKIAVTPSRSYGQNTKSTLALGTNNAAMAQYTDFILPQIYCGYGAANAKLAMKMTDGWRAELTKQKAKTQLWPLLLVRYGGATPRNTPQRLFQQSIGSMAHGADGVAFYYPGNMDAPYWNMVARLNEDLAKYEDFYHDGKRIEDQFPLSQLPRGNTEVNMYPGYPEPVENPGWSFTAHQLGSKVLLTLINLEEANDLVFGIDVGKAKYISGENVEAIGDKLSNNAEEQIVPLTGVNQWLVKPGQIGYIILERG